MSLEQNLVDFYKSNPKDFDDFTLKDLTLRELQESFEDLDEEVRNAKNISEALIHINATYESLRLRVMERFMADYFAMIRAAKADSTMIGMLEKAKAKTKPDTEVTISSSSPSSDYLANLCTPIVPNPKMDICRGGNNSVYPGQIIYMNIDGHERPYRVMNVDNGKVDLIGLFSLGTVKEKDDCYVGGATDKLCADWFVSILPNIRDKMFDVCLPNSGETRYIHAPLVTDIEYGCEKWSDGTRNWMWIDEDDNRNIRVLRLLQDKCSTVILSGEDGEYWAFYDDEDDDSFKDFDVFPAFRMTLDGIYYTCDKDEWLECYNSYAERTKKSKS